MTQPEHWKILQRRRPGLLSALNSDESPRAWQRDKRAWLEWDLCTQSATKLNRALSMSYGREWKRGGGGELQSRIEHEILNAGLQQMDCLELVLKRKILQVYDAMMNTTPGTTFKIQLSAWGLVDDEALLMIIADEQAKEISSLNSVNCWKNDSVSFSLSKELVNWRWGIFFSCVLPVVYMWPYVKISHVHDSKVSRHTTDFEDWLDLKHW